MPVLSRFHGIILRIPKLLPHVENLQAVFGLFKGLHPFVLRVQQGDGRLLAVIFRPGRSEVRILPVAPRAAPYGVLLFLFCMNFVGQQKGGFEQPVPRALRPAGQKRPGGAFLGRGLANPFGRAKKRIAMYFCNAFFVFILCQNSFSNISSAASVYCPFDSRSFLS